jgi:phage N-6-adenine-methyltransferase
MTRSIINTNTRSDEVKQSIATPWPFIHALEQRFGVPVDFDLAATAENAKAPDYWTKGDNALKSDWSSIFAIENPGLHERERHVRLAFCNPPFSNLKPWAKKLAECRWLTRWTVMLAPSSHDADWFQLLLRGKVQIDAIPRIQFETNTHLYPKGLALYVAGFGVNGSTDWDWRASYAQWCRARNQSPDPVHMKGLKKFPSVPVLPDYSWTPSPFRGVGT